MEKKPKQTAWHGGSQIEPAKKLDMNMHLIGPEILSLAEVDVPPEDLVFHKFYVNKMNTSKPKKKKKKKAAEEEAAEDLFDVGDGDGGGDDDDDDDDH
ncbi:CCAAT-BINDING FACTOR-RELATED [Salix koriyanagi]|uniref:CCAAT-BINDING FACTOR-RELATED n=1 Tax=Salix koriyanagi TaxID=2511006 RepID=A0A9Q0Q7Q4_9ROSI|nr:CCAAT-BINDING FACTOR-RELATED [Salix koriyanagi]